MKKIFVLFFILSFALVLAACGPKSETNTDDEDIFAKSAGVMTYAEYVAAPIDSEVTIETFIQARQSWWTDAATGVSQASFYTQDKDGGYFLYNLACSEADYNEKLVVGARIRVKGTKTEWAGEVEITDATYEVLRGSYVSQPVDVTYIYGTKDLDAKINQKISISGVTVVGEPKYKWNGSGSRGDDIYFDVVLGGEIRSLVVESYLCDKDSDTYKAVEALKAGEVIDLEGMLYWYNGPQPHITKVTVKEGIGNILEKTEGAMSGAAYLAAAKDSEVTIEAFIQGRQSWWLDPTTQEGKASLYLQDEDCGYFVYDMVCTEDEYKKLTVGTRVKIHGYKSEWSGEIEIVGATYEILPGQYIFGEVDVTLLFDDPTFLSLQPFMNRKISATNLTVVASNEAGAAFLYRWNGSGSRGDDLYFKVQTNGGAVLSFTVESYYCDQDSAVYKAVEALNVGDKISITAILYWYEGPQPHVNGVTVIAPTE